MARLENIKIRVNSTHPFDDKTSVISAELLKLFDALKMAGPRGRGSAMLMNDFVFYFLP